MKMGKKELGIWGEALAAEFLISKGYRILTRNFRTPHGELDIVAGKNDFLLFVEVKTRTSHSYFYPEDSVTRRKQMYLLEAAKHYLSLHPGDFVNWQFDVIAIELDAQEKVRIEHFENVFQ
jgi:putative endonuclease